MRARRAPIAFPAPAVFAACAAVFLSSCLTTGGTTKDAGAGSVAEAGSEAQAAQAQASTGPEPEAVPTASPEATGETALAETGPAENPGTKESGGMAIGGPETSEVPESEDSAPIPLPGERMITFYPEPDLVVTSPAETSAAKEPSAQAAPAASAKAAAATAAPAAKTIAAADATAKTDAQATAKPAEAAAGQAKEPETGIWTSEPVAPSVQPATKTARASPSRSVTLTVGQALQVWYPGSGWVYLGDASTLNGLAYDSRKLDKSDTLFLFKSLKEGSYNLEFSRYDVLADDFSEDTLAVTVLPADKPRTGTVRAPDYRSSTDTAAEGQPTAAATSAGASTAAPVLGSGTASASGVTDEPALTATAASGTGAAASAAAGDPRALLDSAKASIAKGDPAAALSALDSFFAVAVQNLDEGWFLRGQAYETNGTTRNVKKALESYQTLVSAFPESARWKEADSRIRYIRRFYMNVR